MHLITPSDAIVLEGSPYGQGMEHGRRARAAIRENLHIAERSRAALTSQGRQYDYTSALAANAAFAAREAPEMLEEIRGIANGAGVDYQELLALNLPLFQVGSFLPRECSQVLLMAPATTDGRAYLGKTRDASNGLWRQVVLQHHFAGERQMLGVHVAGTITWPGSGINSDGLMLSSSGVWSQRTDFDTGRIGDAWLLVNTYLLLRDCRSVDELAERLAAQPRLANTIVLATDQRSAVALEATLHEVQRSDATRGWLVRTNHFLHPAFQHLAPTPAEYPSTYHRYGVAKGKIEEEYGHWDGQRLLSLLADHDGYPQNSICRHAADGEGSNTLYASVASLPDGGFTALIGHPCEVLGTNPADAQIAGAAIA